MPRISQVDIHQVKQWLDDASTIVLDIRDPMSYATGHIPTARHMDNENVEEIINSLDKEQNVVICCYHGNSSQGAAGFFMEQGFSDVHSMMGGFEEWKHSYPAEQG
ncbi:MAG: thiosulfate sulfurtransferase GlpE [Nitrospina sp.]|nr:thiosulfate sulfurtransferase GlpE [Nitrospina sp.]